MTMAAAKTDDELYSTMYELCMKDWPDLNKEYRETFNERGETVKEAMKPEIDEFMNMLDETQKHDLFCFGDETTSYLAPTEFHQWRVEQYKKEGISKVKKLISRRTHIHEEWLMRVLSNRAYDNWEAAKRNIREERAPTQPRRPKPKAKGTGNPFIV